MSNTENTSNQLAPIKSPAVDPAPSVRIDTPAPSPPANNKPNPNMVMALVLCFMLIIGLMVAFVVKFNEAGDGGKNKAELSEKEKLQRLIDAERNGEDYEKVSEAALEARISTILENAQAIQSEFESIRVGYKNAQDKLQQLENQVQGNMNTISRLGSENTAIKNQNTQLQTLARNAQSYQNQAQQLANAIAEKDALIATLQERPSNESLQQLRERLNSEQTSKDELVRKIQGMEQKMRTMVASDEVAKLADLQAQNDELRRRLQELQTDIDFAKLFVKSHKSLPLNAQALYTRLKGLETSTQEELREAYTKIATELNAEILGRAEFAVGSSILDFTAQTKIKAKLDATNANDYFLVVGYASETGDAASNETLSANRATAVASIVNQIKKDGQDVRAVYLGQTDRFSKSDHEENQVSEIWRIKGK